MYLTYAEYQAYGGTLSVTAFNDLEFEAEALVNYATFNRLKTDVTIPETVKRLMKYLVDLAQKKAESMSLGSGGTGGKDTYITNQSNDGVSVSYSRMAATDLFKLCEAEAHTAIRQCLVEATNEAGRKLLYRGLYPGE